MADKEQLTAQYNNEDEKVLVRKFRAALALDKKQYKIWLLEKMKEYVDEIKESDKDL